MEIVQEELRAKNGPNGARSGTIVDKDTNEPIATYTKQSYGKKYDLAWHPTFKALNPSITKSYEALDLHKEEPESLDSAKYAVERIHSRLANQDFKDRFATTSTKDPEDANKITMKFHDAEGNHVATRRFNKGEYGDKSHSAEISPDFVAKHNIPTEIADAVGKKLGGAGTSHTTFADNLEKQVAELQKKKIAVGTHAFGNAHVGVFHVTTTPEEASSAHEDSLKDKFKINRLSPTHFVGTSNDGTNMVHSTAFGNQLHQITTNVDGYSAKKLQFGQSL